VYKHTIQAVRLRRAPAVGHEWAQIQLCIKVHLQCIAAAVKVLMCCWLQVAKVSIENRPTKKQALRPRAAANIADQVTSITVRDPCSMAAEPCVTSVEARHC